MIVWNYNGETGANPSSENKHCVWKYKGETGADPLTGMCRIMMAKHDQIHPPEKMSVWDHPFLL